VNAGNSTNCWTWLAAVMVGVISAHRDRTAALREDLQRLTALAEDIAPTSWPDLRPSSLRPDPDRNDEVTGQVNLRTAIREVLAMNLQTHSPRP
jgi:hypothetical protein